MNGWNEGEAEESVMQMCLRKSKNYFLLVALLA